MTHILIKTNKWYKYRGRTCKDWSLLESERLSKATLVVNSMCHMPNITAASVNKCTYNPEHTLLNQIVHQWTKLYSIVLASLNSILHPLHSIAFHFILHKQLFIPQKLAEKVPTYWWQNFAIVVCKSLKENTFTYLKFIYLFICLFTLNLSTLKVYARTEDNWDEILTAQTWLFSS